MRKKDPFSGGETFLEKKNVLFVGLFVGFGGRNLFGKKTVLFVGFFGVGSFLGICRFFFAFVGVFLFFFGLFLLFFLVFLWVFLGFPLGFPLGSRDLRWLRGF